MAKAAEKDSQKKGSSKKDSQKKGSSSKGAQKKGSSKKGAQAKPNIFVRTINYFKDVRAEMKRVVWPDRQEVINSSAIVITTLAFFIIFVLIVDTIASFLIIDTLATLGVGG